MTRFWQRILRGTLAIVALVGILAASAAAQNNAPSPSLGSIAGRVTYVADAQRPWRYARYYVKQAKTGELAEALVALRGPSLARSAAAAPPQTFVIDQKNFQFVPETVAARVGDFVKFTNSDQATHNVNVNSDIASFNASMASGGHYSARLEQAGGTRQPLEVGCVFHSAMRAYVFAFDHPYYQLTAADGSYKLQNIPPGSYDLEMVHPAGGLKWRQRVEVQPGEALHVDIRLSPDDKK